MITDFKMSAAKMNTKKSAKSTPPVADTPVSSVATGGSNVVSSLSPTSSLLLPSPSPSKAEFSIDTILAALRAATPEQLAEFLELSRGGHDLWVAKHGTVEAPVKPSKVPRAKAVKKEKVAAPAPLPLPDDGTVPTAASYRLSPADIDSSVCVGRVMKDGVDDDKRWKPSVYRENQCGGAVVDGSDLCATCSKRSEKAAETGKHGPWNGRVTETPPEWCHMLGTTWAAKCKWIGDGGSDSASVATSESAHSEKMEAAAAKKEAAQAKKDAAAAAKAEKDAEKAKAKAEKEAAAVAKKEAAAAAKKSKPAAKKDTAPVSNAVADTSASVATVEGELEIIGHTMYWVRDGNVYEYDEDAKTAGDFIGRKNEDGTIDEDADEVVAAEESDSE